MPIKLPHPWRMTVEPLLELARSWPSRRRKSGDVVASVDRHHAVQLFNRPARPWSASPEYLRRDGQREPSLHP